MSAGTLRSTIAFLAAGLLVAGPVAACICVDTQMAEMPCCPDGSMGDESPMSDFDAQAVDPACQPVSASPLPAGPKDLPAALPFVTLSYPDFAPRAPPACLGPHDRAADTSPPIYLVTLRLRV
jgi:hypothetical protein